MKKPQPQQQAQETRSQVIRTKWGDPLIDAGFAIMPTTVIEHFVSVTGHDSVDFHIIAFLNSRWWKPDAKPFPSKQTIADALGVHPNSVRRRIKAMEEHGLIKRVRRRSATFKNTNIYVLDGLIQKLEPVARQLKADRETNQKFQALRAKQKKVKLKIVPT